jgi:osmotically-inducible protein OsmY
MKNTRYQFADFGKFGVLVMLALPTVMPGVLSAKDSLMCQGERGSPNAVRMSEERITKEVRHELLSLPNYGVFDNLAFRVNGSAVTLFGQASRPTLKTDAENVVKRIEGVASVRNDVEPLPLSPNDDRIRALVYARLYRTPALQTYTSNRSGPIFPSSTAWRTGITDDPPVGYHAIHIIVKNGHVTLEGAVLRDADRNIATAQANAVPGVFSVTNNLRVDS